MREFPDIRGIISSQTVGLLYKDTQGMNPQFVETAMSLFRCMLNLSGSGLEWCQSSECRSARLKGVANHHIVFACICVSIYLPGYLSSYLSIYIVSSLASYLCK